MSLPRRMLAFFLVASGTAASGEPSATAGFAAQPSEVLLMQMKPGHVSRSSAGQGRAQDGPVQAKGGGRVQAPTATPAPAAAPEPGEADGASGSRLLSEVQRVEAMIASLEGRVVEMGSCCNCTGGGGKDGGGGGKGYSAYTTTFPNGPVSAGGAPTTTAAPTGSPPGLCAVFGDPHFITFDGGHTVLVGERAIWLVKTASVWLQALSLGSDGKFAGFAAGGAFMRGHTLIVYNDTERGHLQAVFDGRPILNGTVDEFHEDGILEANKDDEWAAERYNDRILDLRTEAKFDIGDWHERFLGRPEGGLYVLKLPSEVEVTITGVDFMSMVITMPRPQGAQSGYCGNFNGEAEDDARPVVPSWNAPIGEDLDPVSPSLNLFTGRASPVLLARAAGLLQGAAGGFGQRQSSGPDFRSVLDVVQRCPGQLLEMAQQRCGRVEDARMERDCIFDVCLTRDMEAADDMVATEILEQAVNSKGIPVFMGHGQCWDSRSHEFAAFKTNLRTERECQELLRHLAFTRGVLGAQIRRSGTCQVLMANGTDPTAVAIPGGWAGSENLSAPGRGLVSSTSSDAAWSCWQLV